MNDNLESGPTGYEAESPFVVAPRWESMMLSVSLSRKAVPIALSAFALLVVATAPVGATGVAHGAIVEEVPRTNTPNFLDNEVRANFQVGNRIIVGGDFTQVDDNTFGVVEQPNLAAYDLSTGRLDMNFLPDLDGGVNSIVDSGDGTIIVAGLFNNVNGVRRTSVAKLNVVDGSPVTAFRANANAEVNDVVISGTTVYFGGSFTLVNGATRSRLAAVDLTTGNVRGNFDFPLTEGTGINGAAGVRALDVTPDGSKLVVGHNAHRVGGQIRQSLAMIDISGTPALSSWQTAHYDADCQPNFPEFTRPLMRDLQVSPDGTYFVVVTSIGNFAPMCDVAVRFPISGGAGVEAEWVSRLFDTPEAVAITDEAIYIGGHFRWLMDTGTVWTDWPNGNTNTQPPNTVVRDQIGALDIDTGTALDWDPGATGQRGVLDLRVGPAGLLVGTDGRYVGGISVRRHALLELPDVTSGDTTDPTVTIAAPVAGSIADSPVLFSGTATDNVGMADVLIAVRNLTTLEYLQLDGTFTNAGWQLHRTFVPDAYSPTSSWLWTADLPKGAYRITVRGDDLAGNRGPSQILDFYVGPDTSAPNGSIAAPTHNEVFTGGALSFGGAATDDVAVADASVIIKNVGTGRYLQPGGGFGSSWNKVPATLADPGTASTAWSWAGTLPAGAYRLTLDVSDAAGKRDPTLAAAKFVVDNAPPDGSITVPASNATFTKGAVTFNGSAIDNVGVKKALVIIQDRDTGKYLQKNGNMGSKVAKLVATLADRGDPQTDWVWSGSLTAGRYRVKLQVKDLAGYTDPTKAKVKFRVK